MSRLGWPVSRDQLTAEIQPTADVSLTGDSHYERAIPACIYSKYLLDAEAGRFLSSGELDHLEHERLAQAALSQGCQSSDFRTI